MKKYGNFQIFFKLTHRHDERVFRGFFQVQTHLPFHDSYDLTMLLFVPAHEQASENIIFFRCIIMMVHEVCIREDLCTTRANPILVLSRIMKEQDRDTSTSWREDEHSVEIKIQNMILTARLDTCEVKQH